jgi:hypothetical protein
MEQSPSWEANSRLVSQEISGLLRNPKVYYRDHRSPPQVSILSQMNPVHTFPLYFPKIRSSHLRPGLPSGLFTSGLPYQNTVCISRLSHVCSNISN